ncbi:transposable element Tc1 transposase [Trichonephila clavipes]|nr:transposable element Tc1 transposase [Trichonephila clavipes]
MVRILAEEAAEQREARLDDERFFAQLYHFATSHQFCSQQRTTVGCDEVEKLAYQLNEEAERTERPIRRLSRIIGKLEEDRSVTSVAAEFGIAHSIVSRLWRQFQTTGAAIRGFSSGRPRGPHPQMTGTLSYRPEETGGRQREKSLDTRHRRLDDRYRVLPWPEDCMVVVCLHDALYGVYL